MNKTKIDWCDYTWNPVVGCSRVCSYCYAARNVARFHQRYVDLIHKQRALVARSFNRPEEWTFANPLFIPERLGQPARLKKPSWVFVCSMGELFDPKVPDEWREDVFAAMWDARQHVYVVLTKQVEDARRAACACVFRPPPRCIIGASLTGQGCLTVDEEAMLGLLDIRVHFPGTRTCVSAEPLLGPLSIIARHIGELSWLIIGAQTGPGAVKPEPEWIAELVEAAQAAGVPMWVKDNAKPFCRPEHFMQQRPSFEEQDNET